MTTPPIELEGFLANPEAGVAPEDTPYQDDPDTKEEDNQANTWPPTTPGTKSLYAKSNLYSRICQRIKLLCSTSTSESPPKLRQTAWLDGLRGVAALLVVLHHLFQYWYPELHGPALPTDSTWTTIFRWPLIQFWYKTGSFSVACFFIISGYSLSWKPISLGRADRFEELYDALASSVFRRPFRLFIPPAVTTLLSMPALYFNWFPHTTAREGWEDTLLGCAQYYIAYVLTMINPFSAIPHIVPFADHFPHLWTMAVEFRGSMIIFLLILSLSKLSTPFRLTSLVIITLSCFTVYDRAREALFIIGLLLCEAQQIYNTHYPHNDTITSVPPEHRTIFYRFRKPALETGLIITFILSLLLKASITPMEDTHLEKFLATIAIICINYSKHLQRIFTTRFAQYLGRISFSLYMIHGVVLFALCDVIRGWFAAMVGVTLAIGGDAQLAVGPGGGLSTGGEEGEGGWYTLAMVMTASVSFPILFALSDLTARGIDDGAVRFAGWLWRFIEKDRQ